MGSASGSQQDDWGDPHKYPELGGSFHSLTALNGSCAWNATTGLMTVTMTAGAAQTVILGARPDNVMTVNGGLCQTSAGPVAITKTALKTLSVVPSAANDTGNQLVIVDFLNGLFGAGATAGAGIKINTGGGTADEVRVRGTSAADTFTLGTPVVTATAPAGTIGIGTGTDNNRDIEIFGAKTMSISVGDGADVLTAAGGAAAGASSTPIAGISLTLSGGAGNDTITGGSLADILNGGDDNDTLNGALGNDFLNGELGDDTVLQNATSDGSDVINCGDESSYVSGDEQDTVSYASRSLAVTVTIGAGANDGVASENDNVGGDCENVVGGTAGDTLTGDTTANHFNTLTGGAGNDTFLELAANTVQDTFVGGLGTDTVDYSAHTLAITVVMDGATGSGMSGEGDIVGTDVENLVATASADTITGNDADNVITGGAAADVLNGGDGNDIFNEGNATNGGDTFNGDEGSDTVNYADRVAAITVTIGATANDGLAAENDDVTSTVENVIGSSTAANTLTGDENNNELTGGSAADTLTGGDGNDILDGGSAGTDTLACGVGNDIAFGMGTLTRTACEL